MVYQGSLFRHEQVQTKNIQSKFNVYYDQSKYEYLRERLKKENIHTYDCGLSDLTSLKLENSLDFLYLSNILQYYEEIPEIKNQENVHNFLKNKIVPLLKKTDS